MTKIIETKEELEFIKSLEEWNFVSLNKEEKSKMIKELKTAAENTIKRTNKKKPISIRLSEEDISKIKAISLRKWIPYQTYIWSILHSFTNWTLVES